MRKIIFFLLMLCSVSAFSEGAHSQFIKSWLLLGPFAVESGKSSLTTHFVKNEADLMPVGGTVAAEKRWQMFETSEPILDFRNSVLNFSRVEGCAAYAYTNVFSSTEQTARLLIGSDDEFAVWVNGKAVLSRPVTRKHQFGSDSVRVDLIAGWNRVLFKVGNLALNWQLSAELESETPLRVQAANPIKHELPLKSAEFFLRSTRPNIVLNPDSKPLSLDFTDVFVNETPKIFDHISVKLVVNDSLSFQLPALENVQPGEVRHYRFQLRLGQADTILAADQLPEIVLDGIGLTHRQSYPWVMAEHWLENLFQPLPLENWISLPSTGNREFEKIIRIPADMAGLGVQLQVDAPGVVGTLAVNGRRVRTDFTGYSGIVNLTSRAAGGQRYTIRMAVPLESATTVDAGEIPFNATLRFVFPTLTNARQSALAARNIFNAKDFWTPAIAKQAYQLFRRRRIREMQTLLNNLTGQIDAEIPQADLLTLNVAPIWQVSSAEILDNDSAVKWWHNQAREMVSQLEKKSKWQVDVTDLVLLSWLQQHDAPLFYRFKKLIIRGQIQLIRTTWGTPTFRSCSDEAFVRHFFYGHKFIRKYLPGEFSTFLFPPNTFLCPCLPQILSDAGIKTVVQANNQPFEQFVRWQGNAETVLQGHWLAGNQIINDLDMSSGRSVAATQKQFGLDQSLKLFPISDWHTGELTKTSEVCKSLDALSAFPNTHIRSLSSYETMVNDIQIDSTRVSSEFPFFQGKPTTAMPDHAIDPAYVRVLDQMEQLLLNTEKLATIAGEFNLPVRHYDMDAAWQKLLLARDPAVFNKTSVAAKAMTWLSDVDREIRPLLNYSMEAIAANVNTRFSDSKAAPFVVFNMLNWQRTAPVEVKVAVDRGMNSVKIYDANGEQIPLQIIDEQADALKVLFMAEKLPAFSYQTYWIEPVKEAAPVSRPPKKLVLENHYLRAEFESGTNGLGVLFNKITDQDLISGDGIRWNVSAKEHQFELVEDGPLRQVMREQFAAAGNYFGVYYTLYAHSARLKISLIIETATDESIAPVHLNIPLAFRPDNLIVDRPFGASKRALRETNYFADKWLAFSDKSRHMTLYSNYGQTYQWQHNAVTVTYQPQSYRSQMGTGGFFQSDLILETGMGEVNVLESVQTAENLSNPLIFVNVEMTTGKLPPASQLLKIEPENVKIMALKLAEDKRSWIVRVRELSGEKTPVTFQLPRPAYRVYACNAMEEKQEHLALYGYNIRFSLEPHQIKTFRIDFENPSGRY